MLALRERGTQNLELLLSNPDHVFAIAILFFRPNPAILRDWPRIVAIFFSESMERILVSGWCVHRERHRFSRATQRKTTRGFSP